MVLFVFALLLASLGEYRLLWALMACYRGQWHTHFPCISKFHEWCASGSADTKGISLLHSSVTMSSIKASMCDRSARDVYFIVNHGNDVKRKYKQSSCHLLRVLNNCLWCQSKHANGLVQEKHNSNALAMELCLSCTNSSMHVVIWWLHAVKVQTWYFIAKWSVPSNTWAFFQMDVLFLIFLALFPVNVIFLFETDTIQ